MTLFKPPTGTIAGLFFCLMGASAVWVTRATAVSVDLANSFGFPRAIGLSLFVIGVAVAISDFRRRLLAPATVWRLRPCLAISASVLAFTAGIEYGGLIPAAFVSVLVAAFGSPEYQLRHSIVLAFIIAVAVSLLFVGLLGQPIKLFAGFL